MNHVVTVWLMAATAFLLGWLLHAWTERTPTPPSADTMSVNYWKLTAEYWKNEYDRVTRGAVEPRMVLDDEGRAYLEHTL